MRAATTHADLGPDFYDIVAPARFPQHILRYRNQCAAAEVGLDGLDDATWIDHFGRFVPLPGSFPAPLALRYHGHQFQHYNPDLGDGRGFLFAQLRDEAGRLLDLGTKGSGQTPWSRGGDGRLTLKGGVREILATSMLEALGVDTSRSFSLIETGEALARGDEPSPTRSAVLVRLNHSHIRIGTFQRLAARRETDNIRRLLDHCIAYYLPEAQRDDPAAQAVAFLDTVVQRVARLAAQYMAAGFVHGVLNTDNINITGESFDYGPWRFLPTYDPAFTAAYFDHSGLYAYGRQPETMLWNLSRLAECLLPLTEQAALVAVLDTFSDRFRDALDVATRWRLGIAGGDMTAWWVWLAASQTPFEQAFHACHRGAVPPGTEWDGAREALDGATSTRPDHPYFRGAPCTMLIDEVEAVWDPIAGADDWRPLYDKLAVIDTMREAYGG